MMKQYVIMILEWINLNKLCHSQDINVESVLSKQIKCFRVQMKEESLMFLPIPKLVVKIQLMQLYVQFELTYQLEQEIFLNIIMFALFDFCCCIYKPYERKRK